MSRDSQESRLLGVATCNRDRFFCVGISMSMRNSPPSFTDVGETGRRGNANKNNVTDIHALVRHSQKAQRIPREAAMAPVSGARSGLRTRCKQDKRPLEQLSNRERGARAAKDLVDGVRKLPSALQLAVS